jgi:glutamate-1-semialdehyde 2,1-aminomutase
MSHRDLYARALETAPGGVHSPVRAFQSVGGTPIFFASGHGARLTDVTGHHYIDLCMSFGPLILGHHDQVVAEAVHEAVDRGWSFGACEPYSLALAEWIRARVRWLERLRFVSSGTEAVMSALRVARAATGRSKVLKFEGCYHGHADGMLVRAGSGLAGPSAATSAGIPEGTLNHTVVVPLDNELVIDEAFQAAGSDLAAVILEPVPANYGLLPQRHAWVQHVVARCRQAGTLVIFDEVITGFRSGPDGAAGAFGIVPDLVCYGKVIGGGFPVAAYGGRADLMNLVAPVGPVYQAGTLSANPVGMRAGLVTLEQMADREGWRVLDERTETFVKGLSERLAVSDPRLSIVRHASIFWIHRRSDEDPIRRPDRIPNDQADWYRRFFHAALTNGVYLPPSPYEVCFLSLAHDDLTLALAADALAEAAVRSEDR